MTSSKLCIASLQGSLDGLGTGAVLVGLGAPDKFAAINKPTSMLPLQHSYFFNGSEWSALGRVGEAGSAFLAYSAVLGGSFGRI